MNGRVLILIKNMYILEFIKRNIFNMFVFSSVKSISILLNRQCPNGEVLLVEIYPFMRVQQ